MHFLELGIGLLGIASQVEASPASRRHGSSPTYSPNLERANAVKDAFQRAWDGYYKYAFPHDSLRPVTNTYLDDRNGWGASAVDALSTALVMQNREVIDQILAFVPTIDFNNTATDISLFETTIRYLGGLLSAYDLLDGPLKKFAKGPSSKENVLKQAQRLADNLKVAFDTPTGIPDNGLRFDPPRRDNNTSNGLATIGTLVLEWTRLSDLTGDPEYGNLAQKGESYLLNPQPSWAEPWPGLVGTNVDLNTGKFLDAFGGWIGGDDSFYEYLMKMYVYDSSRFGHYKDRWVAAADSSIKHLASHPSTMPEITFLSEFNNQTLIFQSQHLACFDGGSFILGGLTLNSPDYLNFGLALAAACHETYAATATRIGPESFQWQDGSQPSSSTYNQPPPADQEAFYDKAGFWITNSQYILRPEVIESYYYAYRATGDPKYQEWAWDAFYHINKTCSVGSGFSGIRDVNAAGGGGFDNLQQTFLFAEVMKYSYLIQADDAAYQVQANHENQFVFNTEAHPLRIFGNREA